MSIPRIFAPVLTLVLLAPPQPAQAGFFEMLFGGGQAPAPAAPPAFDLPAPRFRVVRPPQNRGFKPVRKAKPVILREGAPGLQEAAQSGKPRPIRRIKLSEKDANSPLGPFLNDPTLRRGDVVVTREGLKVFDGGFSSLHSASSFRPLPNARHLVADKAQRLAAIERANGWRAAASPAQVAERQDGEKPGQKKRERIVASD